MGDIPKLISEDDNKLLLQHFSMEEVKKAVFTLGADKSPGPDGFPAFFFQKIWEVVKDDILAMVEESREKRHMSKDLNSTFIALIPKKPKVGSFDDTRPISLCNIAYKIIAKVMANRLKKLLPKIISKEQSGFTLNRSIVDGIIIAHEAIHSIRIAKVERMLVKIDIKKAYDLVNREFVVQVLKQFGFHHHWIDWVYSCISSPRCLILVNGSPQGFFSTSRGIHQGDPLSPFLFIIMAEALGRMINQSRMEGQWRGINIANGMEAVTHTQFADGTLLFGEASLREARIMKCILDRYCKVSRSGGQLA